MAQTVIYSRIRGKCIIDVEPSATIATTKNHQNIRRSLEEGEHLFHSHMWVKGTPLHFIVDNGIQNNMISTEFIKILKFPTKPCPQPYTIGWLSQGRYHSVI
jgi:hypothetical protein